MGQSMLQFRDQTFLELVYILGVPASEGVLHLELEYKISTKWRMVFRFFRMRVVR